MRRYTATLTILIVAMAFCWMISGAVSQAKVKSRAYVGHTNDKDVQNFVAQYPKMAGTRLDDCQTCHRSGIAGTDTEREYSICGYCHLIQYPNSRYKTGVPKNYEETLNAYGLAYKRQGRTVEALAAIANLDSDSDGIANCQDLTPVLVPSQISLAAALTNTPQRAVALSWSSIPYATNSLFFVPSVTATNWQLLTNFVLGPVGGRQRFVDPIGAGGRVYRVRVDAAGP